MVDLGDATERQKINRIELESPGCSRFEGNSNSLRVPFLWKDAGDKRYLRPMRERTGDFSHEATAFPWRSRSPSLPMNGHFISLPPRNCVKGRVAGGGQMSEPKVRCPA